MVMSPQSFSPHAIHDRWVVLCNALNREFGFTIHKTNIITREDDRLDLQIDPLPADVDAVFLIVCPRHCNSDAFLDALDKKRRVNLISFIIDMYRYERGRRFEALLERSDLILSMANSKFRKDWPQFVKKFVFWPAFFSPDKRYTKFILNENPIMKCLASGSTTPVQAYPLRQAVLQEAKGRASGLIDVLPFPGTFGANEKGAITRDAFAKLLHSYFCGITTTTSYNCVIPKTVEIPAVGSLLMVNRVEDLDTMGFIPNKHYLPITQDNISEQVSMCLASPEKFRNIRLAGMELVRTHHGFNNRIKQLGTFFRKIGI